jgi:hypothetical protein
MPDQNSEKSTPDQRADLLACEQYGAISLAQARGAGLTPNQVRHRRRTKRWRAATRAVFVVCGAPSTWQQTAMVACLAGPAGTVASHLTGAALYGLWDPPPVPHVTVPRTASGRFRAAIVHHAELDPADVSVIGAVPCTRPARILVECAGVLGHEELCELVDEVLCRRLTTVEGVHQAMARAGRSPGRKGLINLERALEVWTPGPHPGSPAEMRLARRLVRWGFPPPQRQVKIYDGRGWFVARVDLGWSNRKVGLEYDGERHHGPRQRPADVDRQARVEALGWELVRVRSDDLRGPGAELRATLARLLAA